MADKIGLDAALAIILLFKRKDDQHALDIALNLLDAVRLPGPELRADEVDHRNAEAIEHLGEAEMNFRKVDEHGDGGAAGVDGALKLTELAIDARQVAHDLGESHDRHVFRADDDLDTGGGHAWAAHAEDLGCFAFLGEAALKRRGQQRSIKLAAGFACRDEDGWGHG